MKYVVVDTETGGLAPEKHSILSLALIIVDEDRIVDWHDAYVNEDLAQPGSLVCDESALAVNGLSVERIRNSGSSPADAVAGIRAFLAAHDLKSRATIVGQRTQFDYSFLKRLYTIAGAKEEFEEQFSYRLIDTCCIAQFLDYCGSVNLQKSGFSLAALLKHFSIANEGAHDALHDAIATAKLFIQFRSLVRNGD